ncbi:hypothetical protein E4P41_16260 [Geodermatophilus sp. DF01-2]|uniref:hypothetical protein n=1 Tax=Geodermatophilus sp. DF01-2 TaxID=2559610 RepID=UPI00107308B7|nr:hypothetical protein [Geodermatophilus sp. DF01_2]TFV56077.1 hypothetical protein E4P41_16260 [Geodermatophilus sp. DF01_2]
MNALVTGAPAGTALAVARALTTAGGPVTLVSSDTAGLLAALDAPGMTGVDVLWADPASPAGCDDAVVHRRLVHATPEALVLAVDDPAEFALGAALARRLPGVPWVVAGGTAAAVADAATALATELGEDTLWALVPGTDPSAVEHRLTDLREAAAARPAPLAAAPALGSCAH